MKSSERNAHWIERIVGGITVSAAAFGLLWYWDTWELSLTLRVAVSAALGILFLVFGGSVWRWIDEIDTSA